jgi:hypothetical protein
MRKWTWHNRIDWGKACGQWFHMTMMVIILKVNWKGQEEYNLLNHASVGVGINISIYFDYDISKLGYQAQSQEKCIVIFSSQTRIRYSFQ